MFLCFHVPTESPVNMLPRDKAIPVVLTSGLLLVGTIHGSLCIHIVKGHCPSVVLGLQVQTESYESTCA